MVEVKSRSPTNIALVKYWGKHPSYERLHIPTKSSVSFTVADLFTETNMELNEGDFSVSLSMNGKKVDVKDEKFDYVRDFFDKIASVYGFTRGYSYDIETRSNFPTAAGFASSASGFSALAVAFARAMEKLGNMGSFDDRKLSVLARLGSGSAARSVPSEGGLVIWHRGWEDAPDGDVSELSYAETLQKPSDFKELSIIYAKVDAREKKIKSRAGMKDTVQTAQDYWKWVDYEEKNLLPAVLGAARSGDWSKLFSLVKEASDNFHGICLKTVPPLDYLNETSRAIINVIRPLDYAAYTFDAGPNAVVFALRDKVDEVEESLKGIVGDQNTTRTKVGGGPTCEVG